jgi:hypothetical protein
MVFNFVLFSAEVFNLVQDVFGAVVGLVAAAPLAQAGTAGTAPVAATPA